MARILTQLRKLEGKAREQAREALEANKVLYVTDLQPHVFTGPLNEGDEIAVDTYLTEAPLWSSNYVFLRGHRVERITRDPEDWGRVYDASAVDHHHDWHAGPPAGQAPLLGRATGPGGRVEHVAVAKFHNVIFRNRRKPLKVRTQLV